MRVRMRTIFPTVPACTDGLGLQCSELHLDSCVSTAPLPHLASELIVACLFMRVLLPCGFIVPVASPVLPLARFGREGSVQRRLGAILNRCSPAQGAASAEARRRGKQDAQTPKVFTARLASDVAHFGRL